MLGCKNFSKSQILGKVKYFVSLTILEKIYFWLDIENF